MSFHEKLQPLQEDIPLVVDLDGTLIRTDMLFESANVLLARNPLSIFRMTKWFSQGKPTLKSHIAQEVDISPELLPYNSEVLNFLEKERQKGRTIILATASTTKYAEVISSYLGIFDEVLSSDMANNLKGSHKAEVLISRFGKNGFDYVGDSSADLEVWKHARTAFVVNASTKVLNSLETFTKPHILSGPEESQLKAGLKALRLHQWVKNLLVFVPLVATHRFLNPSDDVLAMLAFLSFGLVASAIYVVNDLADIENDRRHNIKSSRPLASGQLSIPVAWGMWPLLLIAGFGLSLLFLPPSFSAVLLGYLLLTTAYSLGLKRIAILDVVILAALYTLRIIAGAFVLSVPPSFWILTFSLFFFLSLALMKRFSELFDARAEKFRGVLGGRGYSEQDINLVFALGVGSGLVSVVVFMFYVHDPAIESLYSSPMLLWLTGPLLLIWVCRAWLIAHRGQMHVDPIVFALKDQTSYLIGVSLLLVFVAAVVF